jgi:hypothetical protein
MLTVSPQIAQIVYKVATCSEAAECHELQKRPCQENGLYETMRCQEGYKHQQIFERVLRPQRNQVISKRCSASVDSAPEFRHSRDGAQAQR